MISTSEKRLLKVALALSLGWMGILTVVLIVMACKIP